MDPKHAYAHGALVKMAEHNVDPVAFVQAALQTQNPLALKVAVAIDEYSKAVHAEKSAEEEESKLMAGLGASMLGPLGAPLGGGGWGAAGSSALGGLGGGALGTGAALGGMGLAALHPKLRRAMVSGGNLAGLPLAVGGLGAGLGSIAGAVGGTGD